ncbi:MAG: AAA family ATPase [Alicyclobacillus sp.]|nr:AAA family ATPase [Alicyclobacillus sp.]
MMIRRLDVQSVLHFARLSLDFSDQPSGLHILYGPNEAGKSTLLRVLVDLLFGGRIAEEHTPLYSRDSRIHGVLTLGEVGGETAAASAGPVAPEHTGGDRGPRAELDVRRRRKRSSLHLVDANDRDLPEELLQPYLHGVNRDRYTLLFGMDHKRLRTGGDNLLQSGGDAGISLFEAGGGLQTLQQLLEQLRVRAEELLDPSFRRNSSRRLNAAWAHYQEARRQVRESGLRGDDWHALRAEVEHCEAEVARLAGQMRELQVEQQRLQRVERNRAGVHEWLAARRAVDALPANHALPEPVVETLSQLLAERERAQARLAELAQAVAERERQLQTIPLDPEILPFQEAIDQLHEQLGRYQQDCASIPRFAEAAAQLHERVVEQWRELQPGRGLDELDQFRIPAAVADEVDLLVAEQEKLAAEEAALARQKADLDENGATLEQDLAALGRDVDVEPLRRQLEVLAQRPDRGDIEGELTQVETEIGRLAAKADQLLQRQTLWTDGPESLAKAPVPLFETVERYARLLRQANEAIASSERDLEQLNEQLGDCRREMESLALNESVVGEADLVKARRRRDEGWALVKRAWLEEEPLPLELAAFAGDQGLLEAYEAAVQAADDVADRMWREADVTMRFAQCVLRQTHLTERIAEKQRQLSEQRERCAAVWANWVGEWQPSGIAPRQPEEMKDWLLQVYRPVVDTWAEVQQAESRKAALLADQASWRTRLSGVLAASGIAVDPALNSTLQDLVAIARDNVQRATFRAEQRIQVQERLARHRVRAQQWQAEQTALLARSSELAARWQNLRGTYGHLPEDLAVAKSETARLRKLFEAVDEQAQRLAEMHRAEDDCRAYEQRVTALAEALGTTLGSSPLYPHWVRATHQRVSDAQRQQALAVQCQRDLETARRQRDEVQVSLARVERSLAAQAQALGCTDVGALPRRIEAAVQRRAAERAAEAAEQRLQAAEPRLTVEELVEEVTAAPGVDELAVRLRELEDTLADLGARTERAHQALGSARARLDALDGSRMDATRHAEQAQAHLAAVDGFWNEYVRVELARRLLQRAIDDFRRANESAILNRAGDLLRHLTAGRHVELAVEFDGAHPYLEVVDANRTARRVQQLSDGTRDQLYLALRLAFVEQQLHSGVVLPLVLDDLLVHSDDHRTRATLAVLAELGRHTQVLYFTHHQSIVDAARELRVRVHNLESLAERGDDVGILGI